MEIVLACPPLPVQRTLSDDSGRFVLAVPSDAACRLIARKQGYVETSVNGEPARGGYGITVRNATDGVELRLTPGGSIAGIVTDDRGAPVSDAFVHLVRRDTTNGLVSLMPVAPYLTLGAGGKFEVPDARPGEYLLVVRPAPGTTGRAMTFFPGVTHITKATPIVIRAGERLTLDLKLLAAPTYSVSGQVLDSQERPVPAITVTVGQDGALKYMRGSATTDETGRFALIGLEDGVYVVSAARNCGDGSWEQGQALITVSESDVNHLILRIALR